MFIFRVLGAYIRFDGFAARDCTETKFEEAFAGASKCTDIRLDFTDACDTAGKRRYVFIESMRYTRYDKIDVVMIAVTDDGYPFIV